MNALKSMRWLAIAILSLAVSVANAQLFGPGFKASDPFRNSPLDPRVYGPNSPKRPNTNTSWLSNGGTQNSWQQQQQQIAQQQAWQQQQQQITQQQAWQRQQQQIAQQQAWQRQQQQIAQQQAWQRQQQLQQQQAALLGGMINDLGRSIDEGIRRAQYENAMRQAAAEREQAQYGPMQPNTFFNPAQVGQQLVVQRYQIPPEYAGTQPGQLINYGGISYLTNNDGTMSPYQGTDATPPQTQQVEQPAVQRYQIPPEYAGTQPGYVINYGGASYLTNNDGTMSPYQGTDATPPQTQQVEQPAVQRYQIPPEYAGTQPGYVINYGGASYLTNDDGTMSPYQGPEAR